MNLNYFIDIKAEFGIKIADQSMVEVLDSEL